jgi:type IV pilus assembly protein PilM
MFSRFKDVMSTGIGRRRGPGQSKRWIGLDLGSQSIKLVELEQTAGGLRLVKQLIQELPQAQPGQAIDRTGWSHHLAEAAGGSLSAAPTDYDTAGRQTGSLSRSQVVGWLQSALKEFNAQEVHVSVGGSPVAIRRIRVPPMSARELPEAVKWQVKDSLPFPVEETVLDFRIVGEVWEKDLKKTDVLVAAASKPFLQELIATIERCGVRVASISPTPAALWSCVSSLIPEANHGSVVLVEIGSELTHVAIVKDGQLRVVRDLAIGSASMTQALVGVVASERGEIVIDRSMAESFKRRYGVLTETSEGVTEEGVPLFHIASLMRPVLENLLTEMSRFLDFYKVQMEEEGVSRVLLCGGGATLRSLQPFLADGLGVTVELFNPLLRLTDRVQSLEAEQISEGGPRLAVAVGLALNHGQGLNVLPLAARTAMAAAISRDVVMRIGTRVGTLAMGLYLALMLVAGVIHVQVRGRQNVWAKLEADYRKGLETIASRKTLESAMQQVQYFVDGQPVWAGCLKELGALTPSGVELNEVSVMGDQLHIKGRVVSGKASAQGSVSQFVEALEQSIFFKAVGLTSSEMHSGETGKTSFDIQGLLE